MTEPKLWSERDFDECCYAVSGFNELTMVCAEPCRGSYCLAHYAEMRRPQRRKATPRARVKVIKKAPKPKAPKPQPPPAPPSGPTIQEVRALVAARHGLMVEHILAGGPSPRFVRARHEACWEIRRLGKSYTQVAAAVGLKDHTSAINACRRHEARLAVLGMESAA